ncbi:hypothetical protein AC249_AIPGENE13629 [Exaiptasia diaphana]|nr:hypothetical protein AC249_AIPGENE13629 [Exaiptasia diaphana]
MVSRAIREPILEKNLTSACMTIAIKPSKHPGTYRNTLEHTQVNAHSSVRTKGVVVPLQRLTYARSIYVPILGNVPISVRRWVVDEHLPALPTLRIILAYIQVNVHISVKYMAVTRDSLSIPVYTSTTWSTPTTNRTHVIYVIRLIGKHLHWPTINVLLTEK